MRWDRTSWLSVGFYLLAAALVSSLTLKNLSAQWRFEYARGADAAGQYLFICAPILCAVVALNARRLQSMTEAFVTGSRNPRAGAYRQWIRFAAMASLVHTWVLTAATLVVWRSDGVRTVSAQPLVRQFGLIVLACALGSLLGAWIRSVALPALIFALCVFVGLLVPSTHLRPFLLAGSGTFDFSYQGYAGSLMVLTGLIAGGSVLAACWATRWPRGVLIGVRVVAAALAVVAVHGLTAQRSFGLQAQERPERCLQEDPVVCAPGAMDPVAFAVGAVAQSIYRAVPADVVDLLPRQLELVAPGAAGEVTGAVEVETADLGRFGAVQYQTIRTISGANRCVGRTPADLVDSQVVGAAVVIGWFEKTSGIDLVGSYPTDLTSRLLAMPGDQQVQIVTRLMRRLFACQGADLTVLR